MRETVKARDLKLGDVVDLSHPDTEPRPWMQAMVIRLHPSKSDRGIVPTVYRPYLTHTGTQFGGYDGGKYVISYTGYETFELDPQDEVLRVGQSRAI